MTYTPDTGQLNDSTWRAQSIATVGGDYPVAPVPSVSIGGSSTAVETTLSPGSVVFGGDPIGVDQQSVTHPTGPAPGGGPNGEDEARVDLVVVDSTGSAGRIVGTPAVPRDAEGNTTDRRFPNVVQPVPPTPAPSDDVVVIAAVWIPAGTDSSAGMFADWVIPREVPGDGIFDLDLIPGRDLQAVIDNAREGETLVGDRSQTITLTQPLTVTTPNVTLRNINWRYADGTATSNTDDMVTLAADGVSVENAAFDGNMTQQSADADAVSVKASDCGVRGIRATNVAGHVVNINGLSTTAENNRVRDVEATGCRKDALVVQGNGARRTRGSGIRSAGSTQRGTVTIRNGAGGVFLDRVLGENQERVIEIEDFGKDNSASAGVRTVWLDLVIGTGIDQLINATVSSEINHGGLRLTRGGASNITSPNPKDGVIQFSSFPTVRISACEISGTFDDTNAIYLGDAERARIDHCRVRSDDSNKAAIRVYNPQALIDVDHNECRLASGDAISFYAGSVASGTKEVLAARDNRFDNVGGSGVVFDEAGATFEKVLATGNVGRNVSGPIIAGGDTQVSGTTTINNNMG